MSAATTDIQPRCITRQQAAAYCGLSLSAFDDWVRRGMAPKPIPGTRRWDRKAIDAALDRQSGLIVQSYDLSDYGKWKAGRASKTSRDKQGTATAR